MAKPKNATNTAPVNAHLPEGIEFDELGFEPHEGFLVRPTRDEPIEVKVEGFVRDIATFKDTRDKSKERFFAVLEIVKDQPDTFILDESDPEAPPVKKPVKAGMRIGVSGSGAIAKVRDKVDHYVKLHYTGAKVPTPRGDMWEINAFASKVAYPKAPAAKTSPQA